MVVSEVADDDTAEMSGGRKCTCMLRGNINVMSFMMINLSLKV